MTGLQTSQVAGTHHKASAPSAKRPYMLLPARDLHRPILLEILVHIERLEQQMRLMAHTLLQAFILGSLKVVHQDGLILWMRTLVDYNSRPLPR